MIVSVWFRSLQQAGCGLQPAAQCHSKILSYITCEISCIMCPLTSTWPHLNSDVGLEEGGILIELSLCYSIV